MKARIKKYWRFQVGARVRAVNVNDFWLNRTGTVIPRKKGDGAFNSERVYRVRMDPFEKLTILEQIFTESQLEWAGGLDQMLELVP